MVDLIVLLVILVGGVIGAFRGVFKMISSIASMAIALVAAVCLSSISATFVYNNFVEPAIVSAVDSKIEELGAEETVKSIRGMVSSIQGTISDVGATVSSATQGIDVSEIGSQLTDSVMSSEALSSIKAQYSDITGFFEGISPNITQFFANTVDLSSLETLANKSHVVSADSVSADLVGIFKTPAISIITPICFGVIFLLTLTVGGILLGLAFNALSKIKILGTASKIGGAAIGAVIAGAVAIIAVLALFYIAPATWGNYSDICSSYTLGIAQNIQGGLQTLITPVEG